ncbi:uncharacterized protein LOC106673564 [Cimex lectularius]|uniref:Tyrosinase copper-binding domain-containing protein n=1 Tax=Cimex lectularius TaxID=79782 RepID=A0A8I6SID3_CIMLE|nr:uncharacterized protein LOC106673564 [Cimex lectularius]
MSESDARNLLHLFDRPTEPVFMPKGDSNAVFDVPPEYLMDRYKPLKDTLTDRFGGGERIPVKKITLPDLSLPLQLKRRDNFSLFIPHHRKMAARLITIFMGMRNLDDFISASVYCRDRVNPYLFIYALCVAILHRPDTKHLPVPSLCEVFPDKFMDGQLFAEAKEESNIVPGNQRIPLEIPKDYTATDLDVEHRIAYFREDLGVNLHHWHWHLVYPSDGPLEIVQKDRRGELFCYMHGQVLARYNFERFCNNLGKCKRLNNWREPMAEGYFPKLDNLVGGKVWPARTANTNLSDIYRETEQIKFDIQDLERWRDRIFAAIHSGFVVNNEGQSIPLDELNGINILGNLLESNMLSVNRNLYGDLHNMGHIAIGFCHDPDHRNLETYGVMGDSATSMRDPIFYRWHAFIEDIFQEYKSILPSYSVENLDFPGVRVTEVQVSAGEGRLPNQLFTFWQQDDVDLSRGLDFSPRGSIFARFTHLQNAPFKYTIVVENSKSDMKGTVRIFMAPKYDEKGRMYFRDQKNLFVEMDKFVHNLKPGKNVIVRNSSDSSVTIPFERTFRNVDAKFKDEPMSDEMNFCGCGWPAHMLVPKGTPEGFPAELFVMVSNYEDDKVQGAPSTSCSDASSYCGIRDSVYPDKRSMGYPFDRQPRFGVDFLEQFVTPNMWVQNIGIFFTNKVVQANSATTVQNDNNNSEEPACKMSKNKNVLLHLFDRPTEPMFLPKGDNELFQLPSNYLTDHYKPLKQDFENRFGSIGPERRISVKNITLPDIRFPLELGRRNCFSLFVPYHKKMAARLIEVLMGMRDVDDFLSASVYCRDKVNPYLFMYCYSVAMLHRTDTRDLTIPSLCEIFPEKFLDGGLFKVARESAELQITPESRANNPVEIPRDYTATNAEIEHRLAYWREDLGLNLHHWHWHLVYPTEGPKNIVDKDRRGELFYYMHQQIIARYNTERFCNNLGMTEMLDFRAPIKEAYFPKLDNVVAGQVWPPRFANSTLQDINREADQAKFDIQDLERWRDRILTAIRDGSVKDQNGRQIQLTEEKGIDILGNIVEASMLSPNKTFYGDLHNFGHMAIAYCHDPDNRNLEPNAVMGDTATAMRDPVFYRWHSFIDDIFQKYKSSLPAYKTNQLNFPNVRVTGAEVNPEGRKNRFSTFWQKSDVDLSRGLDFTPGGPLYFRFTHLQHEKFSYKIHYENKGERKLATVRIFLAPKFDEKNRPIDFSKQRTLFIEMDKFLVKLDSGKGSFTRISGLSSVTIPFSRMFKNLSNSGDSSASPEKAANNACGCGWPENLLVPKGTEKGFPCQLFVMMTDLKSDLPEGLDMEPKKCSDSASYCGILGSVYPDRRAMGFPFDRLPRGGADTLEKFLTPNMLVTDVIIQHTNKTETGVKASSAGRTEFERTARCS